SCSPTRICSRSVGACSPSTGLTATSPPSWPRPRSWWRCRWCCCMLSCRSTSSLARSVVRLSDSRNQRLIHRTEFSAMRVVVTGAAGNIGTVVTQDLLDRGHSVVAVDRLGPPAALTRHPHLQWHQGAADDEGLLAQVMSGADGVALLAAIPHPNDDDPLAMVSTNVLSTFATLRAAAQAALPLVVV